MDFLTKEQKCLLDILSVSLFDSGKKTDFNDINLKLLWNEAYIQTVGLLAFSGSVPGGCDSEYLAYIRKKLNELLTTAINVNKAHVSLHKLMTGEKIPFVIIKGCASAVFYKDPLLRSMGDVDFLVDEKYFQKAQSVLEKAGFVKSKSDHLCHVVYKKNGVRYEMHSEVAGIPSGSQGSNVRALFDDVFEKVRDTETPFGAMRLPSEYHHGIILLLHTAHHLTGEGVGIRHLCDWATFVSGFSQNEFCEMFEKDLKKIGLWKFAKLITAISGEYLSCPVDWFNSDINDELKKEIVRDIFKSGNLGQKSPDRSHEGLLIGGNGRYKAENVSMLKQFISSANNIVYNNWRISRKLKFLRPLGWVFFGVRYIIRSFFGKRPAIRPKTIIMEASSRKNLYKKIELFTEEYF